MQFYNKTLEMMHLTYPWLEVWA